MQSKKTSKKKGVKRELRLEELLTDDRFDEEDEDNVTDDTLEFLSLDDEAIESYQSPHKSSRHASKASASRYEDDEDDYEDEDDEDEDYEDDEDDEDEDYEDDEDDEDYDYDDSHGGVISRFKYFLADMSTLDMLVAMLGIVVIAGVLVTGVLFVNAKSIEKQVEAFASMGEEIEGISVIGESGLVAVSESARLSGMLGLPEEPDEIYEAQDDQSGMIEVTLNLTSIQSDLKIKFVNKSTGKLISGVPFEVEVSSGSKTFSLKDEDKDGIIYQTGIEAGTYNVTVKPFGGDQYQEYKLPASATSVKVSDQIAYKKVEVADEVKSESEINAAVEDTAQQNTVVESVLQDTVEWVESTKTPIDSDENYEEIAKDKITDPATVSYAGTGFVRMVEDGCACDKGCTECAEGLEHDCPVCSEGCDKCEKCSPKDPGTGSGPETTDPSGPSEPGDKEDKDTCICDSDGVKCTQNNYRSDCPVCSGNPDDCRGKEAETEPPQTETTFTVKSISCQDRLTVGASAQASAETDPLGGTITWSCSSDVVEISSSGLVTAKKAGTATITATCGKSSKSTTITVEDKKTKYTAINLNGNDKVTVNGTGTVNGKTTPEGGTITWTSSDDKIVKIESQNGTSANFKGIAAGTATITAKCENVSREWKVTVENVKYTAITLSGSNTLKINEKITITGKTTPEGGAIAWTTSNEKVAKIDSSNNTSAVVKGVAAGTATITAKCGDVSKEWKITVTNNLAGDTKTKLKDKNGNQIYVRKDGKYVEAAYADYYTADRFYLQKSLYRYTGWQTIDGSVYFFDKNGNYVTGDQVIQGARYTFGSDGKLSTGSGTMGIDVSKHNGNIDWNAVKNSGVSFVIIRCGYRGSATGVLVEDPMFRSNIKGAKAAGLKVGVYFFCQAVNEVEAVEEASMAVGLVSGYGLDMPIFLDVESAGGRGDQISRETRTAVCHAFCQTVQNSGYSAGIYANKTWLNEKINAGSLTGYKIWLAQYASSPTYTTTRYDMWQYSSKGRISGISTDVDLDIRYY